jgi:hypothetical protein
MTNTYASNMNNQCQSICPVPKVWRTVCYMYVCNPAMCSTSHTGMQQKSLFIIYKFFRHRCLQFYLRTVISYCKSFCNTQITLLICQCIYGNTIAAGRNNSEFNTLFETSLNFQQPYTSRNSYDCNYPAIF